MGAHLDRAVLLYQQGRPEQADAELRLELADDPEHAGAHALLAICLADRERYDEAAAEAERAVHQGPDLAYSHYARSYVFYRRDRLDDAAQAAEEAVRLDPGDPPYWCQLAAVRVDQQRWEEAVAAAEQGLQIDAVHLGCNNLRAMALVKLGRREEAGRTIGAMLARDPENALTHANEGWRLLESGEGERALEHFREALRLEPGLDWARQGLVEAIKSRNPIYSVMLRYFLWMGRLSGRTQWLVILGGFFGFKVLVVLIGGAPVLAGLLVPLVVLYLGFVFLSWTAQPIFDLLLRLNRFGRLALSREQILASNLVGGSLLLAVIGVPVWLIFHHYAAMFLITGGILLSLPLSAIFRCEAGWPRRLMTAYTVLIAAAGGLAVLLGVLFGDGQQVTGMVVVFGVVFLLGALYSGWVGNILAGIRPKK